LDDLVVTGIVGDLELNFQKRMKKLSLRLRLACSTSRRAPAMLGPSFVEKIIALPDPFIILAPFHALLNRDLAK
jgi:hypothetical protein